MTTQCDWLLATLKICGITLPIFLFAFVDFRYLVKVFAVFLIMSFVALLGAYSVYADGSVNWLTLLRFTALDFRDVAAISVVAFVGFGLPIAWLQGRFRRVSKN